MQSGKRILGLDVLKVFCISFIVLLHTGVLRDCFSINLDPICRFAVPCFFMVTGFFYHSSVNNKNSNHSYYHCKRGIDNLECFCLFTQ